MIPPINTGRQGGQALLAKLATTFLTRLAEELAIWGASLIHNELRELIQRRKDEAGEQAAEEVDDVEGH
jgi:hypothetical protein